MSVLWCSIFLTAASLHVSTGQRVVIQEVRLANNTGNATAGRVEVRINDVWGTVCDDDWSDEEASVVCRTLGLTGGVALRNAAYGQGVGPIHMDDVFCAGNENSLGDCYFSTGTAVNCQHSEDAAVICRPAGAPTPATTTTTARPGVVQPNNCRGGVNPNPLVQLFGTTAGVGYVQARQTTAGPFGFVCDDGWNTNAAKIVCNELCYNTSLSEPGMKEEYETVVANVTFALDDVRCLGNEASLVDCAHSLWFPPAHDCGDNELASVTCELTEYPTPAAPQPILQCRDNGLIALFNTSRDTALEAKHLAVANLTTGGPRTCLGFTVDDSDPQYISASIPYEQCGTTVTQNATHIIYSNAIFMDKTSQEGPISRVNQYVIKLTCEMPRDATVGQGVQPLTETVTQRTEGEFVVNLTIYQDRGFSVATPTYPFQLNLGDWLNAAVNLKDIDSRLKLVVTQCTAKANGSDPDAPTKPLIIDKCIADRATLETYMLSDVKVGLRLQSFVFVNYPLVVLECEAIVCLNSEATAECDRSCNNSKPTPTPATGRRRRDVSSLVPPSRTVYKVSSLPFQVQVKPLPSSTALPTTSKATPTPTPTTTIKATTATIKTTTTTTTPPTTTTTTTARPATSSQDHSTRPNNRPSPTVISVTGTAAPTTIATPAPPAARSTQQTARSTQLPQQDAALQSPAGMVQDSAVARPTLSMMALFVTLTVVVVSLCPSCTH
ncbi:uncharacterized protein [Littorina saxatilis]|uniref:Uncharacterized protein n=1 Tax=Littorina saxatilis TaxID=31220 RepID=A0AAN9AYR3_9CAEN